MKLENSNEIAFQDLYMVLREVFNNNPAQYTVYENRFDEEDFLLKMNTYKTISNQAKQFFRTRVKNFNEKTANISKKQCEQFMTTLIQRSDLVMYTKRQDDRRKKENKQMPKSSHAQKSPLKAKGQDVNDKEKKFQKIRDRILKTIGEYEDLLEIADDENQKTILKATLKTLQKQLKEVEIMEKRKKDQV